MHTHFSFFKSNLKCWRILKDWLYPTFLFWGMWSQGRTDEFFRGWIQVETFKYTNTWKHTLEYNAFIMLFEWVRLLSIKFILYFFMLFFCVTVQSLFFSSKFRVFRGRYIPKSLPTLGSLQCRIVQKILMFLWYLMLGKIQATLILR